MEISRSKWDNFIKCPLPEVQKLKNAKIKRAKALYKEGYKKTDILKIIIKEFKLERDLNSRPCPKWLSEIG